MVHVNSFVKHETLKIKAIKYTHLALFSPILILLSKQFLHYALVFFIVTFFR